VTASCFYEGTIRHRRSDPAHDFRFPLALAYVDLDELPGLLGGRLQAPGIGPVRFRRADYLPERPGDLSGAVRGLVRDATGSAPAGPIRLLTQLRSFGACFNPVSFYYCFDDGGERLAALVAEVTNTPWGERHAYVVGGGDSAGRVLEGRFAKALHVSPFMGMAHQYSCRASVPGETLSVQIDSVRTVDGGHAFDATLSLRRRAMDRGAVLRNLARFPAGSLRVLALIYWRAARLKLAGAATFPHPAGGGAR